MGGKRRGAILSPCPVQPRIASAASKIAKQHLLDKVGCRLAAAGLDTLAPPVPASYPKGGAAQATAIGTGYRLPAQAAVINGLARSPETRQ